MTLADYPFPTDAQLAAMARGYRSLRCWYCQLSVVDQPKRELPNGHYACVKCLQLTTK